MRLATKLCAAASAAVVVTTVLVERQVVPALNERRVDEIRERVVEDTRLVAGRVHDVVATAEEAELQVLADRVAEDLPGRRITLVLADGRVVADSHERPEVMGNHATRPEILDSETVYVRFSETLQQEMLYHALPVVLGGERWGTLRVALSSADIEAEVASLQRGIRTAALVSLVIGVVLALLVVRRVMRPLVEVHRFVGEFGRSASGHRLIVDSKDEMGDLASAINEMADRLEAREELIVTEADQIRRLEQVRRDFVANVSHELKTPLTSVQGYLEAVLDDAEMDPDTRTHFLQKAHGNTGRITAIVADLLDLARIESQEEPKREALEFGDLAAACLDGVREDAAARDLRLSFERTATDLTLNGDGQALATAVSNLLDNAVKYTLSGGHVDVVVGGDDGQVWVDVRDDGPGIAPLEQERIFERFYRVDKVRSRELGGTGLGLSIVRNVARQHGGHVSVTSDLGLGSTFRIGLPRVMSVDHA